MPTLKSSNEDARIYELCVLYPYPYAQKDEHKLLKELEQLFTEAGGKQVAVDKWGRRGLAYTIGGHDEGSYIVYYYEFEPAKIRELDRMIRITPGVLRHIIVKPPKGYQIEKYADKYEQWLKDKDTAVETKARQKEETLKKKMLDKQKTTAAPKRAERKTASETPAADGKKLSADIDRLIADDDLNI